MGREQARERFQAVVIVVCGLVVLATLVWLGSVGGSAVRTATAETTTQTRPPAPSATQSTSSSSPTTTTEPPVLPPSTPDERTVLAAVKSAVVRLSSPDGSGWGSGTIVSASGVVLTNAHVAAPQAPGLAVRFGEDPWVATPEYMVVSMSPPDDGPAVPTYRARLLVAEGHLDVAVLQIDSMADGSPLPSGLSFPAVQLGDSSALLVGDEISVLGYPALSGGQSISVTTGTVSTFVPDGLGLVEGDRYEIDTDARVAPGNSGGAAVDGGGRLVGVPNSTVYSDSGESDRFIPVGAAVPLIDRAINGQWTSYVSPYRVAGTGQERARLLGWGDAFERCEDRISPTLTEGMEAAGGSVVLTGMTRFEDVVVELVDVRGDELVRYTTAWTEPTTDGCLDITLVASTAGYPDGFPIGTYQVRLLVGAADIPLLTTTLAVR